MMFILLSLLLIALGLLVWRLLRIRRALSGLEDAISRSRRLMPEETDKELHFLGLFDLFRGYNGLVDRYQDFEHQNTGYSDQVDATLGAVQEAVIIFSGDHLIEFANKSAAEFFRKPRGLVGMRIESLLRSTSLLELITSFAVEGASKLAQVKLEQEGKMYWFEASCAKVSGVVAPHTESTLLVLHDITKLKQLEEMRRDFVANVSHELRTPLTIIKGFAETLIEDESSIAPDSRTRFLGKILTNAERLHVLVEDLLTLSRLESKPDQIEPQNNSLFSLLNETVENYKRRIQSEDQEIVLEFDQQVEDFLFDRFRINQVLDNLVENVFRYAPEFTVLRLKVNLDTSRKEVYCAVSDDGPGIPDKDVPHIFERFYRVDKGRSRDRGGTGLGLSITKHIVLLHGGRIKAESVVGQGTTITFNLPYRQQ